MLIIYVSASFNYSNYRGKNIKILGKKFMPSQAALVWLVTIIFKICDVCSLLVHQNIFTIKKNLIFKVYKKTIIIHKLSNNCQHYILVLHLVVCIVHSLSVTIFIHLMWCTTFWVIFSWKKKFLGPKTRDKISKNRYWWCNVWCKFLIKITVGRRIYSRVVSTRVAVGRAGVTPRLKLTRLIKRHVHFIICVYKVILSCIYISGKIVDWIDLIPCVRSQVPVLKIA